MVTPGAPLGRQRRMRDFTMTPGSEKGGVSPMSPMADAARVALPALIKPPLATLVEQAPAGDDWVYEIKYDGYRVLARIADREVRLFTRNSEDWTRRLPHLVRAIGALRLNDTWLDGEIVVNDNDGVPSFQALQNAFEAGSDAAIRYYIFDAPYLDGRDLTSLPLLQRKRQLAEAMGTRGMRAGSAVGLSEHFAGGVNEALQQACRGSVSKDLSASGQTRHTSPAARAPGSSSNAVRDRNS